MEKFDPKTEVPEMWNDEEMFRQYLLDPRNFSDEEEHIATLDVCLDREYRKSRFGNLTAREIVMQLYQGNLVGESAPVQLNVSPHQGIKTEFELPSSSSLHKPQQVYRDPLDASFFSPDNPLVPPAPARVSVQPSSSNAGVLALVLAVSTAVYSAYHFGKKSSSDPEEVITPPPTHSVVQLQELPPPKTICEEPKKSGPSKKVSTPVPRGTSFRPGPQPKSQPQPQSRTYPQPQSSELPSTSSKKDSDAELSKKSLEEIDEEISELEFQRRHEVELSVPRESRGPEYDYYQRESKKSDDRRKRLEVLKDYRKRHYNDWDKD